MAKAAKWRGAGLVVLLLVLGGWGRWIHERSLYAKEATLKSDLFRMRDALDEYMVDIGTCPDSLKRLEGHHIPKIPVDPFTHSTTSWQYVRAKTDRGRPCDVRSGSALSARNGTRYMDW